MGTLYTLCGQGKNREPDWSKHLGMKQSIETVLSNFKQVGTPEQPNLYCFPSLDDCDEENRTAYIRYCTYPWMANHIRILHGGVLAGMVDNAMGLAVLGALGLCGGVTPTITMTVNYKKPTPVDQDLIVRVAIIVLERHTAQAKADLYIAGKQDEILVSASGVYYTKTVLQGYDNFNTSDEPYSK